MLFKWEEGFKIDWISIMSLCSCIKVKSLTKFSADWQSCELSTRRTEPSSGHQWYDLSLFLPAQSSEIKPEAQRKKGDLLLVRMGSPPFLKKSSLCLCKKLKHCVHLCLDLFFVCPITLTVLAVIVSESSCHVLDECFKTV